MNDILNKVKNSFKDALKGKETVNNVIYYWGVIGYLVAYFIVNKAIVASKLIVVDIILSVIAICYFVWHFYVLKKCSPKKPKISKEEKKRLRAEARKGRSKRFFRKLFLKEPITKWDPVMVSFVADVFCITQFAGYINF